MMIEGWKTLIPKSAIYNLHSSFRVNQKQSNKTSMHKDKQSIAVKVSYWLKVVSLGMILGLGLQFAQAWTAPTLAPPAGNVSGPVTTGGNQTKTGSLTTSGLSAPSFVDSNNINRFVDPSGTSSLWGLTIASLPNCDLKTNASGAVYCGVDAGGSSYAAGTGLSLFGSTFTLNTSGISGCTNPATSKIYWDNSNNRLACGADQTGTGGDNLGNHIATQNLSTGYIYSSSTLDAHDYWIRAAGKWASQMGGGHQNNAPSWSGPFGGGMNDDTYDVPAGRYICGIRIRANCDMASSDDACIWVKTCAD